MRRNLEQPRLALELRQRRHVVAVDVPLQDPRDRLDDRGARVIRSDPERGAGRSSGTREITRGKQCLCQREARREVIGVERSRIAPCRNRVR